MKKLKNSSYAEKEQSSPFLLRLDCPTRIDFTGGFTDVAPFRNGRVVHHINLGIESRVSVTLKLRDDREVHIVSSEIATEGESRQLDTTAPHVLISHLLKDISIQQGLDVSICSYAPIGAGLGTSGALVTLLLAGLRIIQNGPESISDLGILAMDAVEFENSTGMLGGCQDEFAAAFGNLNLFSFHGNSWMVLPFGLSTEKLKMLESHLIIVYPGGKRISSDIVNAVMSAYEKEDPLVSRALHSLNQYAMEIENALINFDWKRLVGLVRKVRHEQQKLHPRIMNKKTYQVISELEKDAGVGVKLLGGGGPRACMLVVCESEGQRFSSESLLKDLGYHLIPVNAAQTGLQFTVEKIYDIYCRP